MKLSCNLPGALFTLNFIKNYNENSRCYKKTLCTNKFANFVPLNYSSRNCPAILILTSTHSAACVEVADHRNVGQHIINGGLPAVHLPVEIGSGLGLQVRQRRFSMLSPFLQQHHEQHGQWQWSPKS